MDMPVAGAAAVPGFDPKALRRVLGCFATGVCVLTARDPGGRPVGMTVNSFSSLSLDPPLVLWSIARHSALQAAVTAASHWAINILGVTQAHALSAAIHRDEDDAPILQSTTEHRQRRCEGLANAFFEVMHRPKVDVGSLGQLGLRPAKECSRGFALPGCDAHIFC